MMRLAGSRRGAGGSGRLIDLLITTQQAAIAHEGEAADLTCWSGSGTGHNAVATTYLLEHGRRVAQADEEGRGLDAPVEGAAQVAVSQRVLEPQGQQLVEAAGHLVWWWWWWVG